MSDIPKGRNGTDRSALSVALIGPHEQRRKAVAAVLSKHSDLLVREFPSYPAGLDELRPAAAKRFDVVMVDVDSDIDLALGLVESAGSNQLFYVMAYSAQGDMKLAVRFMRAGVREFFNLPLEPDEFEDALKRAASRDLAPRQSPKAAGKLFVFLGSKGGCGVTTLAANFALALAEESKGSTLLMDFGLPLGDAAINLGMVTAYSVANALQEPGRLDPKFLSSLVAKHDSGLSLLAAPGEFVQFQLPDDAIGKLVTVARQSFDHIVVDAGSRVDLMASALFEDPTSIYLITQVGISELRNANRMISQFFAARERNLQVVLNRYKSSDLLFDDKQIAKALTRTAQWKIPDDYATARRTRNTATPMVLTDSVIAETIRKMARTACGLPAAKNGKKGLFRLLS